ncbi:MAG: hypothetical protein L6246_01175 [Thermodesulfovibrionales bacterium]|nr:hypothetical protein [Nitrospinota bacterium]MCG2708924.1 hypothetical protein [Thermodesulfovibrionales bacterium]
MAEYTFEETKRIALIFVEQYNKDNNTNFSWDDERSYQPEEPYDFKMFDGKKELGVQIVKAVADPDREFIRPNKARVVVEDLRKRLKGTNLPSLSIYLNFENPPRTEEDTQKAVWWLDYFIQEKVKDSIKLCYFRYDASFDEQFLPKIRKFISEIEIVPIESVENHIRIIWGCSKSYPEPWLDDEQRVLIATQKKEKKYSDVILLIDSGTFPIDDFYIPLIKNSIEQSKIKEIWIVNDFMTHRMTVRVK